MLNRLTRFFRSEPSPTHKIVRCQTDRLDSQAGRKSRVLIAADLYEGSAVDAMVAELIERFILRCMLGPPDITLLLVTIIGPCEGSDVANRWRQRVAEDEAATFWMGRLEKADVGVGRPASGALTPVFHSLLPGIDAARG